MTAQTHFDIGGAGYEYGDNTFVNGAFPSVPAEDDLLFVLLVTTGDDDAGIGTPPAIASGSLTWTLEANITLGAGALMLTVWSAVVPSGFTLPEEVTLTHGDGSVHDYFNTILVRGADLAGGIVQSNTLVVDPAAATASINLTAGFANPNNVALVVATEESRQAGGVSSPNFINTNLEGWRSLAAPSDDYFGPGGFYAVGEARLPASFAAAVGHSPTRWLLAAFEIAMVASG